MEKQRQPASQPSDPLGLLRGMGRTRARRCCNVNDRTVTKMSMPRGASSQRPLGYEGTELVKPTNAHLSISRCHRLDISLNHEISQSRDSSGAEQFASVDQ